MVKQLLNHIQRYQLCKTSDKILLAVSGGLDSMVMLHLFRQLGYSIGAAHCNFQLRNDESVRDESFVKAACEALGVPFYSKRFNTKAVAQEKGLSLQMAARELRYEFFYQVMAEHRYGLLATAHHLNDNLETILINFSRGSGIEGLTGIPVKNGTTIRPLLFATKKMLHDYATAHQVGWCEDSSNPSDDYQRNFVRHQIVPRLKELNPNLENTFADTLERMMGAHELAKQYLEKIRQQLVSVHSNEWHIDKSKLRIYDFPEVILWEIIKGWGFNYDQCKLIVGSLQPGKQFLSSSHQLTVDRDHFIIHKKQNLVTQEVTIEEGQTQAVADRGILNLTTVDAESFKLSKNSRIAQLDADKLRYPLCWRSWRSGDTFVPFGMQQRKKVSDFLIDEKISLPAKEKVTVLESEDEIVWVVGLRIDDRYKVTEHTANVLLIETRPV